jgi:hypothetical protein
MYSYAPVAVMLLTIGEEMKHSQRQRHGAYFPPKFKIAWTGLRAREVVSL